jgi:hypothetical protein
VRVRRDAIEAPSFGNFPDISVREAAA